ncbi:MAG TPA: serine/threonine-protein kinase, partial [Euzebya sp.]|nr:serine/threonine-protein kinase [Euzebya sp.]
MNEGAVDVPGFDSLAEIGRGGFGVVYRAPQPGFAREVAIKVLTVPSATLDERSRRRFETETATTGRLSGHPHIITLHQAGFTEAGQPYLVMAFMGGGSLGERLRTTGPISWQEATDIAVRIAGALATAHEAGIVHRDVKPDNILIDDFGAPVLSDFGIASVTSNEAVTATGQITATVAFSPPEVLDGGRPGPLADVFALAATTFALITGHPPFSRPDDESFAQVIARMMREDAPDLGAHGVPPPVAAAIARGLARAPEARTHSIVALGQDLQAAQRQLGQPETAMVLPAGSAKGAADERTLALPVDLLTDRLDRPAHGTDRPVEAWDRTAQRPHPTAADPAPAPTAALASARGGGPPAQDRLRTAPLHHQPADPGPHHHAPAGRRRHGWAGVIVGLVLLAAVAAGAVTVALRAADQDRDTIAIGPTDGATTAPTATPQPTTEPATADPTGDPIGDPIGDPTADPTADPPSEAPTTPTQTPTPERPGLPVTDLTDHPDGPALAATLGVWAEGINTADYQRAFNTYTPRLRDRVTFDRFRDGNVTSHISMPR